MGPLALVDGLRLELGAGPQRSYIDRQAPGGKLGNSSTPVSVVRDTTVVSTTRVESYGLYGARGNVGIVTRERRQMASLAHWVNVQRAEGGRF